MGSKKATQPPPSMPRNSVSLRLDGTVNDFIDNYISCQLYLFYWNLCHAAFRIRYGNRLSYTTPLSGTFYYVLRYGPLFVVLVIVARPAWMIGFCNAHGYFETKHADISEFYMDSYHTKQLPFNGNHKSISPEGTATALNLQKVQRLFHVLCNYKGPPNDQDLARAFGFFVVLIMESKNGALLNRNCKALLQCNDEPFEDAWIDLAIKNWSSASLQQLHSFDDTNYVPHDCGLHHLQDLDNLMDIFHYLHVDSYSSGLFSHKQSPRKLTWDPVDKGTGDGDIAIKQEPPRDESGHLNHRGARNRPVPASDISLADRKSKKRVGLRGGGLGGPPETPELFTKWIWSDDNQKSCDELVKHLEDMGLKVVHSKRVPGSYRLTRSGGPEAQDKSAAMPNNCIDSNCLQTKEEGSPTNIGSDIDIASLAVGQLITDGVISFAFREIKRSLNSPITGIDLIDPTVSFLICNGPEFTVKGQLEALKLSNKRLVIFPVNDNSKFERADGGRHWSLLVLDQRSQQRTRFIHYDSARGINLTKAQNLFKVLQPYAFPESYFVEGETPQQGNEVDCGIYLIGITTVICNWWKKNFASADIDQDWSTDIMVKVNSDSVLKFRKELQKRMEKEKNKK